MSGVWSVRLKIGFTDQVAVPNDQEAMEVQVLLLNGGQHLR